MSITVGQCGRKARNTPILVFQLFCMASLNLVMYWSDTNTIKTSSLILTQDSQQSLYLKWPFYSTNQSLNFKHNSATSDVEQETKKVEIPTNKSTNSSTSTIIKSSVLTITKLTTAESTNRDRPMSISSKTSKSGRQTTVAPSLTATATTDKPGVSNNISGTTASLAPIRDGCPFQNVDPFDPTVMKYVSNVKQLDCSKGRPTIAYIGKDNKLRVNFTQVNKTIGKLDYCQYTRIALSDENDSTLRSFNWSQKFLSKPLQLMDDDELVWVQCFLNENIVSQTFKGRILEKPKIEKRREADYKLHIKENDPLETLSILIVGMDGMSKQNLARTMPKTRDYIINKLNAKELKKFNKVGENTFPNVIALHTGYSQPELYKVWDHKKQYLDDIEEKFIWHEYQKSGYRTSVGFDVSGITAYHYLKRGWKHPTFDYYIRPLTLIMNKDKTCRKGGRYCVGDIPELVVLQDYVIQMVSLFNNTKTKPYFIYNFYTKLTHTIQNRARRGDEIYLNFFQQLKGKNVLNNTVVMFFSDHGCRFGEFRKSFNGKIEINTPFVFFIFPPWFERKYPDLIETFRINQNRLTTFFDIHQTLKELLKFKGTTKKGDLNSRAISLFDEIPMERNCSHADIPMQFCNCKLLSKNNVTEEVRSRISSGLLDAIVNRTKDHRDICALLSLESIKSILIMQTDDETVPYYQVTMTTKPGGGMYEALIKFDTKTKTASLIGDILRLNLYKGQDACVKTLQLKLYCFCML